MKKILIISLWICLSYSVSSQAQMNDYTTYQLAFRKGGKIITLQPNLNSVKVSTSVHDRANGLSQQLIFKSQENGSLLIASSAAPDKFLKRTDQGVTLVVYNEDNVSDYLWALAVTTSQSNVAVQTTEGGKLVALLTVPGDLNQVLTLQTDDTLKMSAVDYSIADDPYRLYVSKKTRPGKF